MKQVLSKPAMHARTQFFAVVRAHSVQHRNAERMARSARQIEQRINETLFQIEQYAVRHTQFSARADVAARAIAALWLDLAAQCVEIDADLADVLSLFARHWLLALVAPRHAHDWVLRAAAMIRILSLRTEKHGRQDARDGASDAGDLPRVTLVLRGLPRGAQPADIRIDLADGATIGRSEDCDWILPGEVVSRLHAQLRYDAEQRAFFIANLSRNGLAIDEDCLLEEGEAEINVGTLLKIPKEGHYRILVQSVFVPVANITVEQMHAQGEASEYLPVSGGRPSRFVAAPQPSRVLRSRTSNENPGRADLIDMAAFMLRDSAGLVMEMMEQYAFITTVAAESVRCYIYGMPDAAEVVQLLFADVTPARDNA